jgi:hypothetical protein
VQRDEAHVAGGERCAAPCLPLGGEHRVAQVVGPSTGHRNALVAERLEREADGLDDPHRRDVLWIQRCVEAMHAGGAECIDD